MRKHLGILSAAALFASVGLASAEEASGTLLEVDPMAGMIVLDDGTAYTVADGVSIDGLQPGDEVTVSFEEGEDGQMVISEITTAE